MYRERVDTVEFLIVRDIAVHYIACHRKQMNDKCTRHKVQQIMYHHLIRNLGIGESAPRWLAVVIKKHNHKQDFRFLTSCFHLFLVHFDSFGSWSREVSKVKGGGWIKRGRLLVPTPNPSTLPPWTSKPASVHPKTRSSTHHYLFNEISTWSQLQIVFLDFLKAGSPLFDASSDCRSFIDFSSACAKSDNAVTSN